MASRKPAPGRASQPGPGPASNPVPQGEPKARTGSLKDGRQTLVVAAQGEAALSPEQRRYRQLQQRIEKARADLQAWDEHAPAFAQAFEARMTPLFKDMAQARVQLVRRLDSLLATKGQWNKPDRRTIRRALCDLAVDLVDDGSIGETVAAEMKVLHDRHADVSLEAVRQDQLKDVKAMIEDMTGIDLGDEPLQGEEDLRERAQRKLHERLAKLDREGDGGFGNDWDEEDPFGTPGQRGARAGPAAAGGSGPAGKGRQATRLSAAQRKQQQQAEEASRTVREVFRKLASALHPDRAADEADRARRTALMQRANQAYNANDLLALLTLQLELEQVDAEHVARASSRHLQHINRVLAEQLEELRDELYDRGEAFSLEFGIEPWIKLNPRKLGPLLEQQVRELQASLTRLLVEVRRLDDPAQARRWVAQLRREQRMQDEDPFDLPF